MNDNSRFETKEEIIEREAQEREELIAAIRTRRQSPIDEARSIIADCTDGRGHLSEDSLRSEISRICVERNRLAGLTVRFKRWLSK